MLLPQVHESNLFFFLIILPMCMYVCTFMSVPQCPRGGQRTVSFFLKREIVLFFHHVDLGTLTQTEDTCLLALK